MIGVDRRDKGTWERTSSLISDYGHALICIAHQPDIRIWEIAERIGIRDRSAQRVVNQLVDVGGYLMRPR